MGQALMIRRGSNGDGNPIGTIIYSTKTDMGDDYLLCNGDQILESNGYGELIDVLGEDKYYTYNDSNSYIIPDPDCDKVYKISGTTISEYSDIYKLLNGASPLKSISISDYGEVRSINCIQIFAGYIFLASTTNVFYIKKATNNTNISGLYSLRSGYYDIACDNNYLIACYEGSTSSSHYYYMYVYDTTRSLKYTFYDDTNKPSEYSIKGCMVNGNYLIMQVNGVGSISGGCALYVDISNPPSNNTLKVSGITGTRNADNSMIKNYDGYYYSSYRSGSSTSNYGYLVRGKDDFSDNITTRVYTSDNTGFTITVNLYYNKTMSDSKFIIQSGSSTFKYISNSATASFSTASESMINTYYIPNSHLKNSKIVAGGSYIYFVNNFDRSATLPTLTPGDNLYAYIKAR